MLSGYVGYLPSDERPNDDFHLAAPGVSMRMWRHRKREAETRMPLLALWSSNRDAVGEFSIEQVVATAGDGSLKDGSVCSSELRESLAQIPTPKIASYVDQCLESSFNKVGLVLQDLVNELGRRLDSEVTNARVPRHGRERRVG